MIFETLFQIVLQLQSFGLLRDMSATWPSASYQNFLEICSFFALDPQQVIRQHSRGVSRTFAALLAIGCVLPLLATLLLSVATQNWIQTLSLVACISGAVLFVGGLLAHIVGGSAVAGHTSLAALIVGAAILFTTLIAFCVMARWGPPASLQAWLRGIREGGEHDGGAMMDGDTSVPDELPEYDSSHFKPASTAHLLGAARGNGALGGTQQPQQQQQQQQVSDDELSRRNCKMACVLGFSATFFVSLVVIGALHMTGILFPLSASAETQNAERESINSATLHDLLVVCFLGLVFVGAVGIMYVIAVAIATARAPFLSATTVMTTTVVESASRFTRMNLTRIGLVLLALLALPVTTTATDIFICNIYTCGDGLVFDEVAAASFSALPGANVSSLCIPMQNSSSHMMNSSSDSDNNSSSNHGNHTTTIHPNLLHGGADSTTTTTVSNSTSPAPLPHSTTTTIATTTAPRHPTSRTSFRLRSDPSIRCGMFGSTSKNYIFAFAAACTLLLYVFVFGCHLWFMQTEMLFFIRAKEPEPLILVDASWRKVISFESALFRWADQAGLAADHAGVAAQKLLFANLIVPVLARSVALPSYRNNDVGPAVITGCHLLWLMYIVRKSPWLRERVLAKGVTIAIAAATVLGCASSVAAWLLKNKRADAPVLVDAVVWSLVGVAFAIDALALVAVVVSRVRTFIRDREEKEKKFGITSFISGFSLADQDGNSSNNDVPPPSADAATSGSNGPLLATAGAASGGGGGGNTPSANNKSHTLTLEQQAVAAAAQAVPSLYMDEEDEINQQQENLLFLRSVVKREGQLVRTMTISLGLLLGIACSLVAATLMFKD